jgi:hypothetical protein
MNNGKYYTVSELVELTGYTSSYFHQIRERHLPNAVFRGGVWFIPKSDIVKYFEMKKAQVVEKYDRVLESLNK